MSKSNPIERAFELAKSGEYLEVRDIERQLSREGYVAVSAHLSGPSIKRQINDLIKLSRGSTNG